ncbi:MAG: V-type ATP synthase subunit D [Candidatus Melainabacteria bacterium]|nr:V-type ATP synthase subunit D [Candidatus Melainabacteria bacterium]
MAEVKFTKTELRTQQLKLDRLKKYLPTLQLKKAMLQVEVNQAQSEIEQLQREFAKSEEKVGTYSSLLTERSAPDLFSAVKVNKVERTHENIAGVDIPNFERVVFEPAAYSLFDTPLWFESAILGIQELITIREKIKVSEEKKRALEKELREVSIRVNLFEKILIPRALENIKKIKIFLGDQQLAAVSQAKVAKKKILQRQMGIRG